MVHDLHIRAPVVSSYISMQMPPAFEPLRFRHPDSTSLGTWHDQHVHVLLFALCIVLAPSETKAPETLPLICLASPKSWADQ